MKSLIITIVCLVFALLVICGCAKPRPRMMMPGRMWDGEKGIDVWFYEEDGEIKAVERTE